MWPLGPGLPSAANKRLVACQVRQPAPSMQNLASGLIDWIGQLDDLP
jgi:hypothetical protein